MACAPSAPGSARRAHCATPEDVLAIQTAAIQQDLMVAALTCNELQRFNAFQTSFAPELRASDARLAAMFRRFNTRYGGAAYHAFKTKLANNAEMRSIHNNPAYCQRAGSMLATALAAEKPDLSAFVRNLNVVLEPLPEPACGERRLHQASPSRG